CWRASRGLLNSQLCWTNLHVARCQSRLTMLAFKYRTNLSLAMGWITRSASVTYQTYASFQKNRENNSLSRVVIQSLLDVTGPDRSSGFPSELANGCRLH